MTMRNASVVEFLDTAMQLGCTGVELRNDLDAPLFGTLSAEHLRDAAKERGLRVLALAEVYGFNGEDAARIRREVSELCVQALACGSESIVLIPEIVEGQVNRTDQINRLRTALAHLMPLIQNAGITALIEPLGFHNSSLRFKEDVVRVLDDLGRPECFGLIHDTFHHALSGEENVYADLTHIVHISGVQDLYCAENALIDAHRGLISAQDRLKNIHQIIHLISQGYKKAFSFEAFSPDVHKSKRPAKALAQSIEFIGSELAKTPPA